jgi:hypothetical protein
MRTQNEAELITSRFICVGHPLVAISKVKPITDEFDKTLNGTFTRFLK